jgi:predicted RNase H-like HicB family nuclease
MAVAPMSCLEKVLDQPTLTIQLSDGGDGYIMAECLNIPGCASQGETREEALANVVDAISVCLDVIIEDTVAKLRSAEFPQAQASCYKLFLSTSELLPA